MTITIGNLCACLGPLPGDEACPCRMQQMGKTPNFPKPSPEQERRLTNWIKHVNWLKHQAEMESPQQEIQKIEITCNGETTTIYDAANTANLDP